MCSWGYVRGQWTINKENIWSNMINRWIIGDRMNFLKFKKKK